MEASEKRRLLVRSKARTFAREVRTCNMALKVPDKIIDIGAFREACQEFGIFQRRDGYWERCP